MLAIDTNTSFNKSKFTWRNPSVDRASVDRYTSNPGNVWSKGHMYRTSYTDMSDKSP